MNRNDIITQLVDTEMKMVKNLCLDDMTFYIKTVLTKILDNASDEELELLDKEVNNGNEL